MTLYPRSRIRNFIASLFITFTLFSFFSCSDSSPSISIISPTLVADYSDSLSSPSVRLCVFAEVNSDIRRCDYVKARHEGSGLEWIADEPRLIAGRTRKFAGWSDFVVPSGMDIPSGKWTFTFSDFSGEESSGTFFLNYDKKMLEKKAGDFPDAIKESRNEVYAVYTDKGLLCYFGEKKRTWNNLEASILKHYPNAKYYRKCYQTKNKTVVYMMPPVFLPEIKPEDNKNDSSLEK